ncbi:hypothetical protein [Porphyromonas macacae]|uniref:hypothetical protein n=1 Tax=Porphyromonas macacae TaxID=28115 RepID=UPI00359FEC29
MNFQKLSKHEMINISGGISRKEYCRQLVELIAENYDEVWDDYNRENAVRAFTRECKDRDWNID